MRPLLGDRGERALRLRELAAIEPPARGLVTVERRGHNTDRWSERRDPRSTRRAAGAHHHQTDEEERAHAWRIIYGAAMKKGSPPSAAAITAHLDRGWELLERGDLDKAEASGKRALGLDEQGPEALTLLGSVASARGERDDALAWYERAMTADPDYVSPILYAAELQLDEEGDVNEALRLIALALDAAEEEEEYLDAQLLKVEALLVAERDDEARDALAELPPQELPEAGFHLRAARCWLDLERLDEAEQHFQKAIALDAQAADAHHGLGMVYELREDERAKARAWLRVRELDLDADAPPWGITQEEFEQLAESALAELPERMRTLLENVPILAADYPSIEVVAEGFDPRMLGFFSGVPYPEKSSVGGAPQLDCVFLYQRNIERMARSRDEVAKEIRITLLHETGHFFGLDEDELTEIGLG